MEPTDLRAYCRPPHGMLYESESDYRAVADVLFSTAQAQERHRRVQEQRESTVYDRFGRVTKVKSSDLQRASSSKREHLLLFWHCTHLMMAVQWQCSGSAVAVESPFFK